MNPEPFESSEVKKSGVVWAEVNFARAKNGLEIHVKTDERIEEFFKSLAYNGEHDDIAMYGREWLPAKLGGDLRVYRYEKELSGNRISYTVTRPAEGIENNREGVLNLSFLRLVGISSPEGVRFVIAGPYSKDYVSRISKQISTEVRNIIREYIVPVAINFRISSQDF